MENKSWIAIYRRVLDDPLWTSERFTKAQAWLDLLLRTEYEDKKIIVGNRTITVKRGQLFTSQSKLAERWKWNRETVGSFLKFLIKKESIDYKTNRDIQHGYTMLTIQNYNEYQFVQQQNRQINQQQADSNSDTTKKTKELKKAAIKKLLAIKRNKAEERTDGLYISGKRINDPAAYLARILSGDRESTPQPRTSERQYKPYREEDYT